MPENIFVYTRPLLVTHSLQERIFVDDKSTVDNNVNRNLLSRDYIGKYCLVDWLDDKAVIDCSLIHQWD